MIEYIVTKQPITEIHAQGFVLFCPRGSDLTKDHRDICAAFKCDAEPVLKRLDFKGGDAVVDLLGLTCNGPVHLMFTGVPKLHDDRDERVESFRRIIGAVMRRAERLKITSLALYIPLYEADAFGCDAFQLASELAATCEMSIYHFDQFITDPKRKFPTDYRITVHLPESLHEAFEAGLGRGRRIGHAVNQARQWCDLPADILTPTELADRSKALAKAHGDVLKCKILTKKEIIDIGMGGLAAVAQGSAQDPRFVIMEYRCDEKDAPTLGLVGKGVTFDSGGLSIKPAARMDEMKDDMAGAAAVMSTMLAIASLKPHINVIGCAPLTENLPSGTAIKPGDIVSHYNGKTSEIKNTDAEGRLILADALAYISRHYTLNALIDLATLTGSCSAALGPFYAGCMSQHAEFQNVLLKAGKRSGDWLWPLPFHDDYKAAIVSDVADVCNIGKDQYRAGAITAGFFLQNFIENGTPWIHLDIAGTSFNVPDRSYYRPGATGCGVRLLIELITSIKPEVLRGLKKA